ncbi:DUF2079 domain-containing protein [Halobium salinum]|uniref:DUF2079 domain-containing protein n=1 Tax=Halobium salinum TaxID=1364940 RepID=A0ABD5PAK2_9EURY|nr:DUF2079 domain-containing protein [Halobium salinum]
MSRLREYKKADSLSDLRNSLPKSRKGIVEFFTDRPKCTIAVTAFVYVVLLSYFSWRRHIAFNTYAFDLGIMEQAVWNTLQGRGPVLYNTPEGASHLLVHTSVIQILIVPMYAIYPSTVWFLTIQAAIIATAGFPIYKIASRHLPKEHSLLLALLFYLNPVVWGIILNGWHPVSLAIPFLLASFYYLQEENYRVYWLFVVLALFCKETVALPIGMLGIYHLWEHRTDLSRRRLAVSFGTMFVAAIWLALPFVLPDPESGWSAFHSYYGYLGGSAGEIVTNAILNPELWLKQIFEYSSLMYLVYFLAPFVFLPILSPKETGISLPVILMVVLAGPGLTKIDTQYPALIIPFVVISFVYAIAKLEPESRKQIFTISIVACLLISSVIIVRPTSFNRFDEAMDKETTRDEVRERLVSEIPDEGVLLTETTLFTHTFKRSGSTYLLDGHPATFTDYPEADYIALDKYAISSMPPNVNMTELKSDMGVYIWGDGVVVLKRGYDGEPKTIEPPNNRGLHTEFYRGNNFNEKVFEAPTTSVSNDWGTSSPAPGVPKNNFTVKWTGKIYVPESGYYGFKINADDGADVSINGKKVAGQIDRRLVSDEGSIYLDKGWNTIRVRFWDGPESAAIDLKWLPPGRQQYSGIPSENYRQPEKNSTVEP